MLIPMEFLSPLTTKTDSGAGVKAASRAGPAGSKQNPKFESVFEQELTRHDRKLLDRNKGPDSSGNTKQFADNADKPEPDTVFKQDEDDTGQGQAAGVQSLAERALGNQKQEVVFILEGEESVNPKQWESPQTRVENTAQEQQPQVPQQQTQQVPQQNEQPAEMNQDIEQLIKDNADVIVDQIKKGSQQSAQHAGNPEIAQFKEVLAAKTETVPQVSKEPETGEVTARMPEVISEADKQGKNKGSEQNLKDNGNPSPLENENEYSSKAGQQEKEATQFKSNYLEKSENTEAQQKPAETATSEPITPPIPINDMIKPEQIKGAADLTQAAMQQPVKPENLFDEIVSRVQTQQDAGKSTMTIQLNPEFLGKVALELSIDSTGLHVKINAEDSGVRGMISSQINTLIESLTNKGITVSEVDVVYAGANFESSSEPDSSKHEGSGRENSTRGKVNNKQTVEYYTTVQNLMDFYFDSGISSVQYTA